MADTDRLKASMDESFVQLRGARVTKAKNMAR